MQLQGIVVWSGVYCIDYSSGTKLIIGSCTGLITNNPCFCSTFDCTQRNFPTDGYPYPYFDYWQRVDHDWYLGCVRTHEVEKLGSLDPGFGGHFLQNLLVVIDSMGAGYCPHVI